MKTEIQPSAEVAPQIKEIIQNRIQAGRQALDHPDPHHGVHEFRKQVKKIRATLRIVRDALPKSQYKLTNSYFRDVSRTLSDARDTAALLDVAMDLREQVRDSNLKDLLTQVVQHLMAKKAAVTRYQFNQHKLLDKARQHLDSADEYISALNIQPDGFDALASGITRVYQRCQRMKEASKRQPDPKTFHEWRKRVKYLRYQFSSLSPIWPAMLDTWEDELHQLTDHLGADHDLYVLHTTILDAQLNSEKDWSALFHFIATQRKGHESQSFVLGEKLFYWKSDQFIGWLRNIWKVSATIPTISQDSLVEV